MFYINPLCKDKININLDEEGKTLFPHLKFDGNAKLFYMEKRGIDFYIETLLGGEELQNEISSALENKTYVIQSAPKNTSRETAVQLDMLGVLKETLTSKEIYINNILKKGSLFANGKMRIYDAYMYGNKKEFATFLKNEYGLGGSYDSGISFESNAKGLNVEIRARENPQENFETLLSWDNVAYRIGALIDKGEYLTLEEENQLANFYAKRELKTLEREQEELTRQISKSTDWKKANAFGQKYGELEYDYTGAIVVARIGDFYEVLGENAVKTAKILDLTLTSRDIALPERVAMVGFPFHVADKYISKLNENNDVVIFENTHEEPKFLPSLQSIAEEDVQNEKSKNINKDYYGILYNWKGLKEENYIYTAEELKKLDDNFVDDVDSYEGAFSSNKTYVAYKLTRQTTNETEKNIRNFITGGYNDTVAPDIVDGWYWETMKEDLFSGLPNQTAIDLIEYLNVAEEELHSEPKTEINEDYPIDLLPGYEERASKIVLDASGFTSEYTWWFNSITNHSVFYFDESQDWEADSEKEAQEWFDSYKGFEEENGDTMMSVGEYINSEIETSKELNKKLDIFIDEKLKEIKWLSGKTDNFTEDEIEDIINDLKPDFENSEFADKEFFDDWYDEFSEDVLLPKLNERKISENLANNKRDEFANLVKEEFAEYKENTLSLSAEEIFQLSYKTYVLTEISDALAGENYTITDKDILLSDEDIDTLFSIKKERKHLLDFLYFEYINRDYTSVSSLSETSSFVKDVCADYRDKQEERYLSEHNIEKETIDKDAEKSILIDFEPSSKNNWLKIIVSEQALIRRYEQNSFMKMPNGKYAGYTYNVKNSRIKDATLLVDMQSDGRERALAFVVGADEKVTLTKNGQKIILTGAEFRDVVDSTASSDYVFDTPKNTRETETKFNSDETKENEEMNNSLVLQGKLAKKPEIKVSGKGQKYAILPIEIDRDIDGKNSVSTYNVTVFANAINDVEKLKVGETVEIKGRVSINKLGKNTNVSIIGTKITPAESGSKNSFALSGFINNKTITPKATAKGGQFVSVAISVKNEYGTTGYDTYFITAFDKKADKFIKEYKQRDLIAVSGAVTSDSDGRISLVVSRSELVRSASVQQSETSDAKENAKDENDNGNN